MTQAPALRASTFVVLSGGAIGAASVRQLLRAAAAGRLETGRIVVIDKDPGCVASTFADPRVELAVEDWGNWLDAGLDALPDDSHLVPYHWAPHVLVDWLRRQVENAGGVASRGPADPPRGLPVDRPTRDGDRALSYATWICPPTCIEPRLCPHTRGAKDWSLALDLSRSSGDDPAQPVVFPCLHFVYGVGTVPVERIKEARDLILAGPAGERRRYLIATSSHCHALATGLEVSFEAPR